MKSINKDVGSVNSLWRWCEFLGWLSGQRLGPVSRNSVLVAPATCPVPTAVVFSLDKSCGGF